MRLSELAASVAWAVKHAHGDDPEVVVQTANGGCPTRHMEPVKTAHRGSDWTDGFFIIAPANPVVVVRGLEGPVSDLAIERLRQLEEAHAQLGGRYIAKGRADAWREGFVEGVRAHVTACGGEAPDHCVHCGANLEETGEGDAGHCPACTEGADCGFHPGRQG